MKRILVIDDNVNGLEPLDGILRQHGYSLIEDISGRNPVEEELRRSNDMLRAIIDAAPTAILGMDLGGNVRHVWNAAAEKMLGWSAEEVMGHPFPCVPDESREEYREMRERKRRGETVDGVEVSRRRRDGTPIQHSIYSAPLHDAEGRIAGNVGVLVDVTERKRAEEGLRASLAEKEVLLNEVHHRVKNNLQIISSLLDLQADYLADEQVRALFQDSQIRIRSMALVHQKLYQSERFAFIDLREYLEELANHLFPTGVKDPDLIALKIEVGEVSLGMDDAIPCGLIVSELISNSLKHAFPGGRSGEISIRCGIEDGWLRLTVSDTGVGLPPGLDFRNSETLGLQLVTLLVKQLRGEVEVGGGRGGTVFSITFPGTGPGCRREFVGHCKQ